MLALVLVATSISAHAQRRSTVDDNGPARRHTVKRGETLGRVAEIYGCSTNAVLEANRRTNTLVPPGTVVTIPRCQARVRTRSLTRDDDARAAQALAVIDGTATITKPVDHKDDAPRSGATTSVGRPWSGKLLNGERLPTGDGYRIRRPERAYGAEHVVAHLRRAIAGVRALHDVHVLAIGDLSDRDGGKLANHASHQSGLDVDVGFYFTTQPAGYPDTFVAANDTLDLAATWALLVAFVRTTQLEDGVEMIFLDYDVQRRLHAYASKRGTPAADLAAILQYPRGKDALAGLVRHWPNHADHFHVRFKD